MLSKLISELNLNKNKTRSAVMQRFFKTSKGQYGEGDIFLGLSVPQQRLIAKRYLDLELSDIRKLLNSKIHEHRLVALIILVHQYDRADEADKEKIYKFYLTNAKKINNWDLVDTSAPYIVGVHLRNRDKKILYKLAKSDNLWEKRIAMIATQGLIRAGQLSSTFEIAKILLADKHDLIHKAVGWMLREAGKKNLKALEKFLQKYCHIMTRTALRYAIEKFPESRRKKYLNVRI